LADRLSSISPQNEICLGSLSGRRLKAGEARLPVELESSHTARPLDRCRSLAERVELLKPPVGRSDGGDLPPAGVQESLPSRAAEWPSAQGCPCPTLSESGCGGTNRQHNTHSTESREVCYPWHPWYGRAVWVYETLVKSGQPVFRCGTEENHDARYLVPQWMFDSAVCCRMHKATVPVVGCEALRDLKALLQFPPDRGVVLQAQHRSSLSQGGADANAPEPIESCSVATVSSTPSQSVLAGTASRNPTDNSEAASTTAARPLAKSPRLPQAKGGAE
jgi:hypothetical protein